MIFTADNIFLDLEIDTKEALFSLLANAALEAGYVSNQEQTVQAFIAREAEFSTGLQDGFAIPHAKDDSVVKATVFFAKVNQSIEWETFDDNGVQYVFALFVPKAEGGTTHLQMLSQLATALMEDEFKEQIKKATNKKELVAIINHEMIGAELK